MTTMGNLTQTLRDSKAARWTALVLLASAMFFGYVFMDVLSPMQELLQTQRGWDPVAYGRYAGSETFLNVFVFFLIFAGIILDKMGVRFTGMMSCILMLVGCAIKYAAVAGYIGTEGEIFGWKAQVALAAFGYAIFGMGAEITGITVTKVIVKWFQGKEMALAMGLQVAMARIGTAVALACSLPLAKAMGHVSYPVLFGAICLCVGLLAYLVYCVMDKKLDRSLEAVDSDPEERFHLRDLKLIFTNKGFWLITLLCLMFYAGVFPFLKFATKLMIAKYHVGEEMAGLIPAMLPFGTILLTPLFGSLYDRIGKGVTLMIIGSVMLTLVHLLFASPFLPTWWFAIFVMVILGIAFSLVPSALWPSVPKIIPMKQLGSAYATIFYIQNIGLSMVPVLIGWVIETFSTHTAADGQVSYDYTLPMLIFASFGIIAIFLSLMLKKEDARSHYGLEELKAKK